MALLGLGSGLAREFGRELHDDPVRTQLTDSHCGAVGVH